MFEKEAEDRAKDYTDNAKRQVAYECGFLDGVDLGYNKANEELEEKISVLLSCKDCPENKDGLICQKEYENKCLAQKIQFIKELQQENAELKKQVETSYEVYNDNLDYSHHIEEQLTEAKKVIKGLLITCSAYGAISKTIIDAEQFLKEVSE